MSNYPTYPIGQTTAGNVVYPTTDVYGNPVTITPGMLPTTPVVSVTTGGVVPSSTTMTTTTGTGVLASPVATYATPTAGLATSSSYMPYATTAAATTTTNNKVVDKLPSNQQIERTLERVREQVNIAKHETEGLNPLGERILVDTERLVDSAAHFLREKNEGGKLQRLAQEGLLARRDLSLQAREARDSWDVVDSFDSDRLRTLARETLQTARAAGLEIVRSRKFRAQLRALVNLLSRAISAERVDSSAESSGLDHDDDDDDYDHSNEAAYHRHRKAPEAFPSWHHHQQGAHSQTAPADSFIGGAAGEVAIPIEGASSHHHHHHRGPAVAGASSSVSGLGKRLEQGLTIRGTRVRLNQEQVNQLAEQFLDLLRDITRRPSTADLLRRVLDIFRLFDEEIDREQRGKMTTGLRGLTDSEHLRRTLALAQEIFETFTGDRTLDPLISHWRGVALSFREDEEARSYFHSLRHFFASLLDHPERLSERQTLDEMKQHIRWAQQLHDEKLRAHLSGSLREAKAILRQVERDPATLRLKNDAKALIADVMLDDQGNVVLKTQALEQIRLIIIQSLVERVRIPVPAVTVNNPDMQMRLSNIVVTLRDLIPERVVLSNSGRVALNLGSLKEGVDASSLGQELVFEINNINIFIEDADIWFKRNKFPKVEDEGKIRISVGGSGVDLRVVVRTFIRSERVLQVDRVECSVNNMRLHLHETRHDFLYNSMVKILSPKIRHNIERSVENNLADYLERINRVLTKQIKAARTKGSQLGPITSIKNRVLSGETGLVAGETRHTLA